MPSVARLKAVNAWLSEDLLGGPKVLKFSWVINFHKAGTVAVVPPPATRNGPSTAVVRACSFPGPDRAALAAR
jgi:hypothetical protein